MAEPVPLADITKTSSCVKFEVGRCIDYSQDVERCAALVKLMGPNLNLRDVLYVAQQKALALPPGEKSDKAAEILAITVARYEHLKVKGKIPVGYLNSFALCRLQYFAQTGAADECRRILREGEFEGYDFADLRRAERRARASGHAKISRIIGAHIKARKE